jgi:exodeoxyribonuclease VII large subunit
MQNVTTCEEGTPDFARNDGHMQWLASFPVLGIIIQRMYEFEFDPTKVVLSVSDYIETVNAALRELNAKIIGEVISVKRAPSGHMYFTLKDKEHDAVIDCIMWRSTYQVNGIAIEKGMELILTGSPNIYAQQGRLSFIARTAEFAGEGALKKAYEALKLKLTREGLLSDERKRNLPTFPQKIGIITSKQGAVIHDFENNLDKRGYKLLLIDSRVEGKEAIHDLLAAIKQFAKEDIDMLVVMRGGGSLQSLAAFDTETVARALATFPVPVLAAIGHHQDVPIAALVADANVSTPTAAAHLIGSGWEKVEQSLQYAAFSIFTHYYEALQRTTNNLYKNKELIEDKFERILVIFQDAERSVRNHFHAMQGSLHQTKMNITHYEQLINVHNPLRLLQLGYSIVKKHGKVVKHIKDVTIEDTIEVLVSDGTVTGSVKQLTNTKHYG